MPIRVLHVVGKMHRGGMETMIMNYYRNIDRSCIQFDFLVHYEEEGDYDHEIRALGGKIYKMPRTIPQNYFVYKKELHKFFDKHREYKIIHGHLTSTAFLYHKISKKYGNKICITHAHNNGLPKSINGIIERITSKIAIRYTDYFMACSKEAGKYYFNNKIIKEENYQVLKNAIPLDNFIFNLEERSKIRKELGIEDEFVVGHIGRFEEQKNHDFLIEIFNQVLYKNPNSTLILLGAGTLSEKIKNKVEILNISDKVKFLGVRNDVPKIMQAMDVFVLPSKFEGLGIVLVEAQANGLRCYASENKVSKEAQVTELLEYINLDKAASEWADAILTKECESPRESRINQISKEGFEIRKQAQKLEKLYIKMGVENG